MARLLLHGPRAQTDVINRVKTLSSVIGEVNHNFLDSKLALRLTIVNLYSGIEDAKSQVR